VGGTAQPEDHVHLLINLGGELGIINAVRISSLIERTRFLVLNTTWMWLLM
jgi:hypothetical protein